MARIKWAVCEAWLDQRRGNGPRYKKWRGLNGCGLESGLSHGLSWAKNLGKRKFIFIEFHVKGDENFSGI